MPLLQIKHARYMSLLHHKTKVPIPQVPDKAAKNLLLEVIDELKVELARKKTEAKKEKAKASKGTGRRASP